MCPVFQTSANRSGEPAPSRYEDVPAEIVEAADLAIDGGELTGLPSTVVDLTGFDTDGEWTILRDGALSAGDLRRGPRPAGTGLWSLARRPPGLSAAGVAREGEVDEAAGGVVVLVGLV